MILTSFTCKAQFYGRGLTETTLEGKEMKAIEINEILNHPNSFDYYVPSFLPLIEQYMDNWPGSYYDCLDREARKLFDLSMLSANELKRAMYNTTSYAREEKNRKDESDRLAALAAQGFRPATEHDLQQALVDGKCRQVILSGTSGWSGATVFKAKKLKLRNLGSNGLGWMVPQAKRRFFPAYVGQLIKQ